MDLARALSLESRELVSFVGAGGKKTAMAHLVREGTACDRNAVYTTTTKMPPPSGVPLELVAPSDLSDVSTLEDRQLPVALAHRRVADPKRVTEKVSGYTPAVISSLFETGAIDWILVKADGARMREFKAPGPEEPQIPRVSTVVVPVVSAHVIGQPLTEALVHRIERVEHCSGLAAGETVTAEAVGRVLAHPAGGLKGVPNGATVIPMVNKADTPALEAHARDVLSVALKTTTPAQIEYGLISSFEADRLTVVQH